MIEIKKLKFAVEEKEIIKWVDINFEIWKNYLLLWRNWSWKSSLTSFLMWNPSYTYDSWEILIEGKNLLEMSVSERSNAWIFLSFQNVPEILGINLWEYLRIIYNNKQKSVKKDFRELSPFVFRRFIKKYLDELSVPEVFLDRDLNVGFSGWEKRKIELLQILLLEPKYIIFDEIDSWLDIDAYKVVTQAMKKINSENNSLIVITHNFEIINEIAFDEVIVLKGWVIDKNGWVEIIENIKNNGF